MKLLANIMIFVFLISIIACNSEDMLPNPGQLPTASCSDGIQNGNELGIDCGGDCNECDTDTSVSEDRDNIQTTLDNILSCVTDLKQSRATQTLLRDFLRMSDGEVLNEDWIDDLTDELEEVVDDDHVEDNNRLDFAFHSGTHQYIHSSNSWQKVNNTSNIVFEFPSGRTENTNNAILSMDRYEDNLVTCLLYTSPSPRDRTRSRMPSSA